MLNSVEMAKKHLLVRKRLMCSGMKFDVEVNDYFYVINKDVICSECQDSIIKFSNVESVEEYRVSGYCEVCQNIIFDASFVALKGDMEIYETIKMLEGIREDKIDKLYEAGYKSRCSVCAAEVVTILGEFSEAEFKIDGLCNLCRIAKNKVKRRFF